jgi:hypothetical protein
MYAFMFSESALVIERLITHITSRRKLTTVYASMCYQIALCIESLITYFTNIEAFTNYICVDVLSVASCK